jgi:anaerobic selenocysteine-containing dehydrogenase/Fe-S-cluster-containing dehydrogenase component
MIDMDACIGCKSCEAACKQEHGLGPHEYRNKVLWLESNSQPETAFLTVTCQHCDRPACLRACPVSPKAIKKDPTTGVVSVDESLCTGCGECVKACPYGAMGYDAEDHHAVKCDLCEDRRSHDQIPACTSVCPTHAIHFGEREELKSKAEAMHRDFLDQDKFLMKPATLYLKPRTQPTVSAVQCESESVSTESEFHLPTVMGLDSSSSTKLDVTAPYRTNRESRHADRTVPGGCNICFNGCPLKFHLKGGKVVGISGNDEDPIFQGRICPKSQMTLQLYNSEKRLKKPLKRVGARGEGKFVKVEWDVALQEISEKMNVVRDRFGSEALAIFMGTRAGMISKYGYASRFAQLWGTPNIEGTDPFCSSGKNLAYNLVQGTRTLGNIYTPDDIGNAELYLYVGDNQAETRPVYFGMVNEWRKNNNARMITVDPRLSVTASKSDEWLAIRSGTDMALGLAIIYCIFQENLHDHFFCDNWVEGWSKWRDFIKHKKYSAEWAAPITDISAKRIKELARDIATANGCIIFGSRGLNQHSNSVQTNRVFMFIAAITGNWGRKGGGYFNMTSEQHINDRIPEHRKADIKRPAVGKGPLTWINAINVGEPYPIKAIISGNNPFTQWPSQKTIREAIKTLDLIVHIDLFKNETSDYADYVLPVTTGIEKGGITRSADDRRIIWNEQLIAPPGDAKSDGWIWIELGKKFGFEDVLKEEYKDVARFWDEECNDTPHLKGCTTNRFMSKINRCLRIPLSTEDTPEPGSFTLETPGHPHSDAKHLLKTQSGKLEFWTEEQEDKFSQLGLSAFPEFYSEREQLVEMPYIRRHTEGEPQLSPFYKSTITRKSTIESTDPEKLSANLIAKGFDTELITGRPPAPHFHSWTHYFWQPQEMWPDLYVQMHPKKANLLGIKDGDKVQIETMAGDIIARVWIKAGIRENAVYVPIGWGEKQPYSSWKSVNFLTSSEERDPFSEQVNLKTKLCRISRID